MTRGIETEIWRENERRKGGGGRRVGGERGQDKKSEETGRNTGKERLGWSGKEKREEEGEEGNKEEKEESKEGVLA